MRGPLAACVATLWVGAFVLPSASAADRVDREALRRALPLPQVAYDGEFLSQPPAWEPFLEDPDRLEEELAGGNPAAPRLLVIGEALAGTARVDATRDAFRRATEAFAPRVASPGTTGSDVAGLARALIGLGRPTEAEAVLRGRLATRADEPVVLRVLARLLADRAAQRMDGERLSGARSVRGEPARAAPTDLERARAELAEAWRLHEAAGRRRGAVSEGRSDRALAGLLALRAILHGIEAPADRARARASLGVGPLPDLVALARRDPRWRDGVVHAVLAEQYLLRPGVEDEDALPGPGLGPLAAPGRTATVEALRFLDATITRGDAADAEAATGAALARWAVGDTDAAARLVEAALAADPLRDHAWRLALRVGLDRLDGSALAEAAARRHGATGATRDLLLVARCLASDGRDLDAMEALPDGLDDDPQVLMARAILALRASAEPWAIGEATWALRVRDARLRGLRRWARREFERERPHADPLRAVLRALGGEPVRAARMLDRLHERDRRLPIVAAVRAALPRPR